MAKKDNKNESNAKKHFFKDFKAELKKVIWPTPKQLFNNTVAVLSIVLITAIIVFVLDFAFESINKYGVNKIKQDIVNSSSNNTEEDNTASDNSVQDETQNNEENEQDSNSAENNIAE